VVLVSLHHWVSGVVQYEERLVNTRPMECARVMCKDHIASMNISTISCCYLLNHRTLKGLHFYLFQIFFSIAPATFWDVIWKANTEVIPHCEEQGLC
jgi:hypothetical protein